MIGVAAAEFTPPLYFTAGEAAQRLVDQGWAAVKGRVAELEGEFREAMQNRAAQVEWRSAEDFPTRYMVQQARACDIIVVGEAGHGRSPIRLRRPIRTNSSCRRGVPCLWFRAPATGWT